MSPEPALAWVPTELTLRGPDGRPLANTTIDIGPIDDHGWHDGPPPAQSVVTDENGVARFEWPSGVSRMKVRAAGVGYGFTGLCEFFAGETARPPIAPLAPYGSVFGQVQRELFHPGMAIAFRPDRSGNAPLIARCDSEGRFACNDLLPGAWFATIRLNGSPVATSGRLTVAPAVKLELKTFRIYEPQLPTSNPSSSARPQQQGTTAWARGIITDETGKPIPHADVFAVATYHGGLRMYEKIEQTVTNDKGEYEIRGEGGLTAFSATIVARADGFLPCMAWIAQPQRATTQPASDQSTTVNVADLALLGEARGGSLDVIPLIDGKSAPGVTVCARRDDSSLRDLWASERDSQLHKILTEIVQPLQQTNAEGVVRFDHLLPGLYTIVATRGTGIADLRDREIWPAAAPSGIAGGVIVRGGARTRHEMNLVSLDPTRPLRVVKSDRTPLRDDHVPVDWHSIAGNGWSSSIALDADGAGRQKLERPGLSNIIVTTRREIPRWNPVSDPPFDQAATVLALSPNLPELRPTITLLHADPGVAEIHIIDESDKPVRADVELGWLYGSPSFCGSTDDTGHVRFDGLPPQSLTIRVKPFGESPLELGEYTTDEVPTDTMLRGRKFFPTTTFTADVNTKRHFEFKQQPAGYLRGKLIIPAGESARNYYVSFDQKRVDAGAWNRYSRETGEFIAGPFVAGDLTLEIHSSSLSNQPGVLVGSQVIKVVGGDVRHVELQPSPTLMPAIVDASDGSTMIGMGGIESRAGGAERLVGRVLMSDGKTPACGAEVYYFVPGRWSPVLRGTTDGAGQIHARGAWTFASQGEPPPTEPKSPVVVALLPGDCGGTMVSVLQPDRPLSITLASSRSVRGTVTIGGKSAKNFSGAIRIVAAAQNHGALNSVMSIRSSAQPDGSFELGSLSAGEYLVQAALDDIWVSSSVKLVVENEPANLALDIAPPGDAVKVIVMDESGSPCTGVQVIVDRPAGPLTDALWPKSFTTDGAGVANIPTLEIGKQTLHVLDQVREIDVPPPTPDAMKVEINLRR